MNYRRSKLFHAAAVVLLPGMFWEWSTYGSWWNTQQTPVYSQAPTSDEDQQHPVLAALQLAEGASERLKSIDSYACKFMKQERLQGRLTDVESMRLKVRHEPFSVYMYCLGPTNSVGEEIIYIAGQNEDKVLAHPVGFQKAIVGTLRLEPTSSLLMKGSLHPVTEIGIKNLVDDLLESHRSDLRFGECAVTIHDTEIDGRAAKRVEITHPARREEFTFHQMRISYDAALGIPIHFARYDWPSSPGGEPVLTGEYSYRELQLEPTLTDVDFDPANPNYEFQ